METLYIVSFADSTKYKIYFPRENALLTDCKNFLSDYLEERFPSQKLGYYLTPKLTEIPDDQLDKYEHFPELTPADFPAIAKGLERDVEVMNRARKDTSNGSHSVPFMEP